ALDTWAPDTWALSDWTCKGNVRPKHSFEKDRLLRGGLPRTTISDRLAKGWRTGPTKTGGCDGGRQEESAVGLAFFGVGFRPGRGARPGLSWRRGQGQSTGKG